jgi:hypothetical protein
MKEKCNRCEGTGNENHSFTSESLGLDNFAMCSKCNGTGEIEKIQSEELPAMKMNNELRGKLEDLLEEIKKNPYEPIPEFLKIKDEEIDMNKVTPKECKTLYDEVNKVLENFDDSYNKSKFTVKCDETNNTKETIEENKGNVSDGYHTFDELYEHRHVLFGALIKIYGGWKSKHHSDGTSYDGWFIAGTEINNKQISYHLPMRLWDKFPGIEKEKAPEWDGHTPEDVVNRLKEFYGGTHEEK